MKKADFNLAKQKADELLKLCDERPIKLSLILNHLGLSTRYATADDDMPEEAKLIPQEKIILVRQDDAPVTRKLFSIAHEIGHFVLHNHNKERYRLDMKNVNKLDDDQMIEEQEANAFAAELLMPYNEVKEMLLKGYDTQDIMNYFNVSYAFAVFRTSFIVKGF